ncbi:hypothetical protein BJ944DRAFT_265578 [Cunninghamella echinulata]|nr:hypothetical protein BJ944DRAFT_265578 [Cunninghamella echinulata]
MITFIHTICHSISSIVQRHYCDIPSSYQIKQLGETLYQNQEYEQAYRLFIGLERLQNSSHIYTSQRYQIRCLVKLGKIEQAIKKCQFILQQSPCNASSWYLLTAEIYLHDQQYTLAWQLLKKSFTMVSSHDPLWEELCFQERMALESSQLHQGIPLSKKRNVNEDEEKEDDNGDDGDVDDDDDATITIIKKKEKMDNQWQNYHHIQALSYDILCNIFIMLPFDSLIRSLRVCHQWNELILQSPLLWQQVGFQNCKIPIHHDIIQSYLTRLQAASLLSFRIDKAFDGEKLLLLLSKVNCHQLHTLDLSSLQCTTEFSFILFRQLLSSAGKTLKKVRIGSSGFKLNGIIEQISIHCTQLETLEVYDCFTSMGTYSTPLQLDQNALYRLEQFGEFFSEAFMEYIDQLPILPIRYLYLSSIHGLTTIHLATILLRCPYLIHLELNRCLVNLIPIINILRFSCPQLEVLSYHRNRFTQLPITNGPNNTLDQHETSSSSSSLISLPNRSLQNKAYSLYDRPHRLPMKIPSSSLSSTNDQQYITNTANNNKNGTSFWKQFSLISSRSLTDDLLHFILKGSYHTIEKLNIKENSRLTDDCLFQMIQQQQQQTTLLSSPSSSSFMTKPLPPALPKLKEFNISNCIHITERGLCAFLKECPQLEIIDLSGLSRGVTDQVLYTMAIYCQQLTHIYLNHCKYITDQGMKQLLHIFLQRNRSSSSTALFQHVELNKTNISMECLGYIMCHIQQDGI